MHAVVTNVTVHDFEKARAFLEHEVVPRVSQAPGLVAGYWSRSQEGNGTSLIVFESEEAARAAAGQIQPPPGDVATIDSVEVRDVVAHT